MEEGMNLVILGIGNPLLGDDGFGVEVARRCKTCNDLAGVDVVDGGSQGLYLLPYLKDRTHIIVADAIAFGGTPGEIVRLDAEQVPAKLSVKMSEHQVSFHEVLALMQLLNYQPQEFVFFGVQPKSHLWGEPMCAEVASSIDAVVEKITAQVNRWRNHTNGTHECFGAAQ
ncbi:MAG: hydrogenase maturation protease [Acidobacteriota bacterium]